MSGALQLMRKHVRQSEVFHSMGRKLPANNFYQIRDPHNFYAAMRSDVELLQEYRKYLSLTTVIMCCIDAIAAGSGKATRKKFEAFVMEHFPQLCEELKNCHPVREGSAMLYDGVGQFVAINVDRLTREFLLLIGRLDEAA